MANWLPIDQAPKDGTKILVYGNNYQHGAGGEDINEIGIAQWGELYPYGDGENWINEDFYYTVEWFPTHFMPLPAPPTDSPITQGD